ncbi:MAG: response regulator [Thermodesulfobacteriota bacterium]
MASLLIVDDEHDVLEVLDLLFSMEGHSVHTARDGAAALEIALTTPLDLVLTDVMMPRMDGIELCRRLKANPRTHDLPIIVHTAGGPPPGGQGTVYDAYLPNPADFDEQRRLVERLLGSARDR